MKKITLQYKKAGFTLIELMVVISIIGILATIITVNLTGAQAKSRDSKRKSDLSMIMSAIVMWGSDHGGVLPTSDGYLETSRDVGGNDSLNDTIVAQGYLDKIPCDPKGCSADGAFAGYHYVRGDYYGASGCSGGTDYGDRKGFVFGSLEKPSTEDSATISSNFDKCYKAEIDSNINIYSSSKSDNPRPGALINFKLSN